MLGSAWRRRGPTSRRERRPPLLPEVNERHPDLSGFRVVPHLLVWIQLGCVGRNIVDDDVTAGLVGVLLNRDAAQKVSVVHH